MRVSGCDGWVDGGSSATVTAWLRVARWRCKRWNSVLTWATPTPHVARRCTRGRCRSLILPLPIAFSSRRHHLAELPARIYPVGRFVLITRFCATSSVVRSDSRAPRHHHSHACRCAHTYLLRPWSTTRCACGCVDRVCSRVDLFGLCLPAGASVYCLPLCLLRVSHSACGWF